MKVKEERKEAGAEISKPQRRGEEVWAVMKAEVCVNCWAVNTGSLSGLHPHTYIGGGWDGAEWDQSPFSRGSGGLILLPVTLYLEAAHLHFYQLSQAHSHGWFQGTGPIAHSHIILSGLMVLTCSVGDVWRWAFPQSRLSTFLGHAGELTGVPSVFHPKVQNYVMS